MNYPEIRFRDPFLLIGAIYNDIEPAYMPPTAKIDERDKLSREAINKKLDEYEKAWRPHEEKLIKGMCDLLNMEFRQNIIDIYAAPFYTSFSFPMFIATKYEPDRAIEVITHELLHVLLYDNTSQQLDLFAKSEEWHKLFKGVEDEIAQIHIPVMLFLRRCLMTYLKNHNEQNVTSKCARITTPTSLRGNTWSKSAIKKLLNR